MLDVEIDDGHSPGTLVVESSERGVTARGDVDTRTAPRLRVALDDLFGDDDHEPDVSSGPALVDLTNVRFMGSAGIAVLLHGNRLAKERGRTLRVRFMPGGVVAHVLRGVRHAAALNVEPAV